MTPQELTARLLETVAAQREDIVDLCADLVAAPSVNPVGDTRQVADVVTQALRVRGIPIRQEHLVPTMPSVVADIDSGRPGPHLVLNVHLDTVPPGEESEWTRPVWELTRTGGRLYGLGMGNMKGAVAAMITAAAFLADHRSTWSGRISFAVVSDEVVFGENGAAHLLREHPDLLGDGLLCGEGPGFERLAMGEKGVLWLELSAEGPAGHSSAVLPGRSAAARIAEAVTRTDALNGLTGALPPELASVASRSGDTDPGLVLTANVGTVTAGTFIGQIATRATAEVDLRLPPGITTARAGPRRGCGGRRRVPAGPPGEGLGRELDRSRHPARPRPGGRAGAVLRAPADLVGRHRRLRRGGGGASLCLPVRAHGPDLPHGAVMSFLRRSSVRPDCRAFVYFLNHLLRDVDGAPSHRTERS